MDNEYSSLIDVALGRGIKHSEIISAIHDAVLKEYKLKYPDAPKEVTVIVDEKTGDVRVLSDREDITPLDFAPVAAQIARQVVIQKIKETESQNNQEPHSSRLKSAIKWLSYLFFWGYNGIYILFAAIFLLNFILNDNFRLDLIESFKNWGVFRGIALTLLALVPLLSIIAVFKAKLLKKPLQLGRLIFFLEVPLIFILLVAFNAFSNATPAMWFFLVMGIFTLMAFFLNLIKFTPCTPWQRKTFVALQQTALTTAGYLNLLYLFFLPLAIGEFFLQLVPDIFGGFSSGLTRIGIGNIIEIILFSFFGLLGLMSIGLLLMVPFLVTYFLFKLFRRAQIELIRQIGVRRTAVIHAVLAAIYIIVLLVVSHQPKISPYYIDRLEKFKAALSFEEREAIAKELIPNEVKIKRALEEMYNIRKKYVMTKDDNFLKEKYKDLFKLSDGMGEAIQNAFITIAYPFVYQGTLDRQGDLFISYNYLFGRSIIESTYKQENYVKLVSRTVRVDTDYQNLLATIAIEEEYENTTQGNQEVVYEFSLPENSVITDLKLGANLEFDGIVAPRGAASKVYQQELFRRKDPALLEQVGPRQYRLRIFPIPGRNDMTLGGKNQKAFFSYVTEITPKGYPLPRYSREDNLRKDNSTKTAFYLNNQAINSSISASFIKANAVPNLCGLLSPITLRTQTSSASAQIIPYKNIASVGDNFTCDEDTGIRMISALKGARLAILYDVSYDNKDSSFLNDLKRILNIEKTFLEDNSVDYYLFNDALSQRRQLTADWINNPDLVYFGKSDWINALSRLSDRYDFVVVITTKNSIFGEKNEVNINNRAPIYLMHKDDIVPAYPTKITYAVLQSGGTVVSTFEEAISRYLLSQRLQPEGDLNYVSFGPYWAIALAGLNQSAADQEEVLKSSDYIKTQKDDPLTYLVNKAYVMKLISQNIGDLEAQTTLLDSFNTFARNTHIVTLYSSMLALVDETQRSNLEHASQEESRYSYEPPSNQVPIGFKSDPIAFEGLAMLDNGALNFKLSVPVGEGGFSIAQASPDSFFGLFIILNGFLIGIGGLIFMVIKVKRLFTKK